jgi:hypothetical protein
MSIGTTSVFPGTIVTQTTVAGLTQVPVMGTEIAIRQIGIAMMRIMGIAINMTATSTTKTKAKTNATKTITTGIGTGAS